MSILSTRNTWIRVSVMVVLLCLGLTGVYTFVRPAQALGEGPTGEMPQPTPRLRFKRGDYVTGFSGADASTLAWMGHFDVVHAGGIGDPLSAASMHTLRAAGVKRILAYAWMPAGYHYLDGEDSPFMQWVYTHRYTATLNPDGPFPHCVEEGYDWCEDYYFDWGYSSVISRRVAFLLREVERAGYDGLFFDWASGRFMFEPPFQPISETFHTRHPSMTYVERVAVFYRTLLQEHPSLWLQTNQGFREAAHLLPLVDMDMTESYVTTDGVFTRTLYVQGQGVVTVPQTVYYPLSPDPFHGALTDTLGYLDEMVDLQRRYAGPDFEGMVFMNYVAPEYTPTGAEVDGQQVYTVTVPRNAIYFAFAVPKLADQLVYTEVPAAHWLERDPVYFYDLGLPLGRTYEPVPGGYVRYYTHGFVLVGEWETPTTLSLQSPFLPRGGQVFDAFEGQWFEAGPHTVKVTVRPQVDTLTGRIAPSGRVYLYGLSCVNYLPFISD